MEKLKNIRFNLRFFNGSDSHESVHSVKELEEKLRNNQIAFDDLMAYFFSGQLQRWLECHGEKDSVLLEKIRSVDKKATNREIVKALFAALGFCFDEQEIDRMIVSYDFPNRLFAESSKSAEAAEERQNTIQNEIDAYEAVCKQIIEKRQDLLLVKKLVRKILEKYFPLLELDASRFVSTMKDPGSGCPAAVLELLSNESGRRLFKDGNDNASIMKYPECDSPVGALASALKSFNESGRRLFKDGNDNAEGKLYGRCRVSVDDWLQFERKASGFYVSINGMNASDSDIRPIKIIDDYSDAAYRMKILCPKGHKVMVLCNNGVSVRDGNGKEWTESALTNQFRIIDGCSYQQIYKTKAFLAYVEL